MLDGATLQLSSTQFPENQPTGTEIGSLSVSEAGPTDTFTFEFAAGEGDTDNAYFSIDGATLRTNSTFDYERKAAYSVRIAASKADGAPSEKAFIVYVTDENEAPTGIALTGITSSLVENIDTTAALKLADISVTDDAIGTNDLTLSGDDAAVFEIVGTELFLKAGVALNYEAHASYSVTVEVADATVTGSTAKTVDLTLTVTDVNEAPTGITPSGTAVDENAAAGTVVGTLTAIDDDAGDSFTYSLVAGDGDTDNASFELTGGVLKTTTAFDYEIKSSYSIRVKALDAAGLAVEKTLTIAVTDLNESPSKIELQNVVSSLLESADVTNGYKVADIAIVDDALGTNTITLSGPDAAIFEIVGTELRLKAGTTLDYGTKTAFDISLAVNDTTATDREATTAVNGYYNADSGRLAIQNTTSEVITLNDFNLISLSRMLDGDAAVLPDVFTTSNHDVGDYGQYSQIYFGNVGAPALILNPGDFWNFGNVARTELTQQQLFSAFGSDTDEDIAPAGRFDYFAQEGTQSVRHTGAITLELTKAFSLLVENDPEHSGTEYIDIRDGETVIDTKERTGDYELLIRGNGTYILEGANAHTGGTRVEGGNVIVRNIAALGTGGLTLEDNTSLELDVIHGRVPLSALSMASTATLNVGFGGLSLAPGVMDLDTVKQHIVAAYSTGWNGPGITSSPLETSSTYYSLGYYQRSATRPLEVAWAMMGDANLDGKVGSTDIRIFAPGFGQTGMHWQTGDFVGYDGRFLSTELRKLRVTWNSAYYNTEATALSLTGTIDSLPESTDTSARIKVADIALEDDGLGKNVYALSGADAAAFEIDGTEFFFNAGVALDFEIKDTYEVSITVTDASVTNNTPLSVDFTLAITDVNEAPTDFNLSSTSIDENMPADSVVGFFTTTDQDAADTFSYALVTGDGDTDNADFKIVGDELQIRAPLNFETKASYTIRVKATDAGGLSTQNAFVISVTDVNEAPASLRLSQTSAAIAENTDTATRIELAEISITDDAKGTNTLSLSGNDAAIFEIDANKLYLKAGAALNYEARTPATYIVTVEAIDSTVAGSAAVTETFTLTVTDVNETPTGISLSAAAVDENAPKATVVGTLSGVDPDAAETFTFALTSGDGDTDNAQFAIVGNELRTEAVFDYEIKNSYSIRIKVTDSAGNSFEKAFTIDVNDLNEAPSGLSFSNATTNLLENDAGARVITEDFSAFDPNLWTFWQNGNTSVTGGELRMRYTEGVAGQWNVGEAHTQSKLTLTGDFDITVDFDNTRNSVQDAGQPYWHDLFLRTSYASNAEIIGIGNKFVWGEVRYETNYHNGSEWVGDWAPVQTSSRTGTLRLKRVGGNTFAFYKTPSGWTYNGNPEGYLVSGPDGLGTKDVFIGLASGTFEGSHPLDSRFDNLLVHLPDSRAIDTGTAVKLADINIADDADGTNALSLSGADATFFELVDTALYLKGGTSLNHEVKSSYTVTVEVADTTATDTTPSTADFTLTIDNADEYPREITLDSVSVAENQPQGTRVGNFSTSDGDEGEYFTYRLVSGEGDSDNDKFSIDNGELRTAAVLDSEVQSQYTVRVRSTDSTGLFVEKVFLIDAEVRIEDVDFSFGFTHINATGAEQYLVDTTGMRKYSEWQSPPITYWGPKANNAEGQLVYRFPFLAETQSIKLTASSSCWDFFTEPGGSGRGASSLEVSTDGTNWVSLHNNLDPVAWGADWSYDGYLPAEVIGATEIWVRMRFLVESAGNGSYTVAQFGRSTSSSTNNVFEIQVSTAQGGSGASFLNSGGGFGSGLEDQCVTSSTDDSSDPSAGTTIIRQDAIYAAASAEYSLTNSISTAGDSGTSTSSPGTPIVTQPSVTDYKLAAELAFAASIGELSISTATKKNSGQDSSVSVE